jgi:hypothetical protein
MPPFTCLTGNCRRTDEHDATGCVVAWEPDIGRVHVGGARNMPEDQEPYRPFFPSPRFKP